MKYLFFLLGVGLVAWLARVWWQAGEADRVTDRWLTQYDAEAAKKAQEFEGVTGSWPYRGPVVPVDELGPDEDDRRRHAFGAR